MQIEYSKPRRLGGGEVLNAKTITSNLSLFNCNSLLSVRNIERRKQEQQCTHQHWNTWRVTRERNVLRVNIQNKRKKLSYKTNETNKWKFLLQLSITIWLSQKVCIACGLIFGMSPNGAMANLLVCNIIVNEFKIQSHYYVHFRKN